MLVSEFLDKVNFQYRGTDDDAPTFGDEEAVVWLSVLNSKINEFYRDTKQRWSDSFEIRTAGTIVAGDETYNLDAELLALSDQVYVIDTDGKRHNFTVIKPQERTTDRQEVYLSGVNPKVLNFTAEVETGDQIVGGTLYVPGYYLPDELDGASDSIPIPNPYWAVYAVAADLAYNDVVYETKAADLVEKANSLYREMAVANRAGTYGNGRKLAYNVKRIESPTRR